MVFAFEKSHLNDFQSSCFYYTYVSFGHSVWDTISVLVALAQKHEWECFMWELDTPLVWAAKHTQYKHKLAKVMLKKKTIVRHFNWRDAAV